MIKDNLKNKVFEAKMDFGNGNSSWLDVHKCFIKNKNMDEIFFIRNKHGISAWHCGSLPINDYRIIEIRKK